MKETEMVEAQGTDGHSTLEDRVHEARKRLSSSIEQTAPHVTAVYDRARRQRLASVAAFGAFALVAVVAVGILSGVREEARSPVTAGEPEFRQPGTGNVDLLSPGEVRDMAPSPLQGRSSMASVWTGTEMIVWGGETPGEQFADGAAYDPATDSWRLLAPSPLSARNAPAAVWTGEEVLLWGGHAPGMDARDGAAYNPATDSWRPIADAPMASAGAPQAVWTGQEMLVLAGVNSVAAAAYEPGSDSWRTLSAVPGQPSPPHVQIAWTGDRLIVRANYRDATPSPGIQNGLFAYDPEDDRWRELPPSSPDSGYLPNLVFVGDSLVQVAQQPGALVTRYDLDSETWAGIARWPDDLEAREMISVWTGDRVLLWGGDHAVLIDPARGHLHTTPAGGGPNRTNAASVWADGVLIVWGGWEGMDDGIVLRPVQLQPSAPGTTLIIPDSTEPPAQGRGTKVVGPDGLEGFLDPTPGPVEVDGRLLPVQRVLDADGNLIGYFGCTFLPRPVVEDPNFDPTTVCSTVTTSQPGG
jgi:N-acetylneuraminic acid mutarotase